MSLETLKAAIDTAIGNKNTPGSIPPSGLAAILKAIADFIAESSSGGQSLAKASQSEAEAGTDDAKYVTPLKAKQAIAIAIAGIIDSSPGTLNTLNELAAALGDDPNFATTVITALAGKAPLVNGVVPLNNLPNAILNAVQFEVLSDGSIGISTAYLQSLGLGGGSGTPTPVASSVAIAGTPTQGQTLTGSFTYSGGTQGTSTYQWFRSDNTSGLNKAAISGATGLTYVLAAGDVGKYIQFAVTPKNSAGTAGTQVSSAFSAVIAASGGGADLNLITGFAYMAPVAPGSDYTESPSHVFTCSDASSLDNPAETNLKMVDYNSIIALQKGSKDAGIGLRVVADGVYSGAKLSINFSSDGSTASYETNQGNVPFTTQPATGEFAAARQKQGSPNIWQFGVMTSAGGWTAAAPEMNMGYDLISATHNQVKIAMGQGPNAVIKYPQGKSLIAA